MGVFLAMLAERVGRDRRWMEGGAAKTEMTCADIHHTSTELLVCQYLLL